MKALPSSVNTVDLKHNNISILPSKSLMYTKEDIKEIKLWFNSIQGVETSSLGKALPMLQLQRNRIKHITNMDFIGVERLKVLDLGENNIITVEKGSFSKLQMLKQLNIDGNRLQSLLPDTFTGLESPRC